MYANITAVPVGNASGYLTAYPSGASGTGVSTVNFMAGVTTANLALLPVSAAGAITITNHSARRQHVLVDVVGWVSGGDVTADAGTQAVPVTRILDTRTHTGGHQAPVGAGGAVSVQVLGVGGVPSTGVAAVVVHVTGVNADPGDLPHGLRDGIPDGRSSSTLNLAAHGHRLEYHDRAGRAGRRRHRL